jgi:capsular polysaccharide biosynthesis protein
MSNTVRPPYPSIPPAGGTGPQPIPEPTTAERIARAKTLARRALGYWKLAFVILIVGCALAVVAAMNVKRQYVSECRVLFKPGTRVGTGPKGDDESSAEKASKMAQKANELIRTSARLEVLIKEYKLYPKTVDSKGMHEAVEEMRPHIGFREAKAGGDVFVISFENEDPSTTQKVAQRLADMMVEELSKGSLSDAKRTLDIASAEEKKAGEDLDNATAALATFLKLHPEFQDIENRRAQGGAQATVQIPKGGTVTDPQLAALYSQRAKIFEDIRRATGAPAATVDPNSAAHEARIRQATEQRDEAERTLSAARADYEAKKRVLTDEHPDMRAAKAAVAAAEATFKQKDAALKQALAEAKPPPPPPTTAAVPPELQKKLDDVNAAINARLAELKKHAGTVGADSGVETPALGGVAEMQEYERYVRMVKLLRENYADRKADLDKARLLASVASASGGDTLTVIDPAYLPMTPTKGGRSKTAIMGGVVALIVAILYAFARVLFNDTLIDQADVEAMKLIPVLGVLPKLPQQPPAGPSTTTGRGGG